VDVSDLVLGHQPWPERTESVVRLALGPLTQALELEETLGHVVADGIAGDVIERVGLGNVFCPGADDDGNFDFPIELGRAARLLDGVVGAAQAVIGLDEVDGFGRN
jgi:hypothetical protein